VPGKTQAAPTARGCERSADFHIDAIYMTGHSCHDRGRETSECQVHSTVERIAKLLKRESDISELRV